MVFAETRELQATRIGIELGPVGVAVGLGELLAGADGDAAPAEEGVAGACVRSPVW